MNVRETVARGENIFTVSPPLFRPLFKAHLIVSPSLLPIAIDHRRPVRLGDMMKCRAELPRDEPRRVNERGDFNSSKQCRGLCHICRPLSNTERHFQHELHREAGALKYSHARGNARCVCVIYNNRVLFLCFY